MNIMAHRSGNRKSIRLKGYDYSTPNAYFITICTQNHVCLFGDIVEGEMECNDAGKMIKHWYKELERKFVNLHRSDFVCMPNHVHFIITIIPHEERIEEQGTSGVANRAAGKSLNCQDHIPGVVQWFKTMTTNSYIRGVRNCNWQSFHKRMWQRNYYEHIIRNNADLDRIRLYIQNNPATWEKDMLNPQRKQQNG